MIAARMHDKETGSEMIMLVLEPGNFEKLKQGMPIHRFLNEFIPELQTRIELLFCYTPDAEWVSEQMQQGGQEAFTALRLAEIIDESLSRPEVVVRDQGAEDVKRVF